MSALSIIIALILLILAVAVVACLILLIRLRMIGRIVGTFDCWMRPDLGAGWSSGLARFGRDDLQWFRLVGFFYGPQLRLPRLGMRVSTPISKNADNVVVEVTSNGQVVQFAMREEWYNGLVSWVESSEPLHRYHY